LRPEEPPIAFRQAKIVDQLVRIVQRQYGPVAGSHLGSMQRIVSGSSPRRPFSMPASLRASFDGARDKISSGSLTFCLG
jgi:hypothetical protein